MAPPHWASLVQGEQVWVARSQLGVVPWQSAFVVHPTHVPLAVSQAGVVPPQRAAFVAEHWPHAPVERQAGVAPPH